MSGCPASRASAPPRPRRRTRTRDRERRSGPSPCASFASPARSAQRRGSRTQRWRRAGPARPTPPLTMPLGGDTRAQRSCRFRGGGDPKRPSSLVSDPIPHRFREKPDEQDRSPWPDPTSVSHHDRRRDRRNGLVARSRQGSRLRAEARADLPLAGTTSSRPPTTSSGGRRRRSASRPAVTVRVDTIAHLQLPAKRAAEAQSQSGHDMYPAPPTPIPFLFENHSSTWATLVDKLGKQYGGWYPFAAECCQTEVGLEGGALVLGLVPGAPTTWRTSRRPGSSTRRPGTSCSSTGKVLKKQGNPVGIAISHCGDANTTYWSVLVVLRRPRCSRPTARRRPSTPTRPRR